MKKLILIVFTSILIACGGGDDDSLIGHFGLPAVQGLTYSTETQSGTTDAQGTFRYNLGETINFKLGGIDIGTITAKSVINPIDLGDTVSSANISRLLYSLDSDKYVEDGLVDLSYIDASNTQGQTLTSLNDAVIVTISGDSTRTLYSNSYCYDQTNTHRLNTFQESNGKLTITSQLDSEAETLGESNLTARYGVAYGDIDVTSISADITLTEATFNNVALGRGRIRLYLDGNGKDASNNDMRAYGGLGVIQSNDTLALNYFLYHEINDVATSITPVTDAAFTPVLGQNYSMVLAITDTQVQARIDGNLIKAWNLSDIPSNSDGIIFDEATISARLHDVESADIMTAEIDNLVISAIYDGDEVLIVNENFIDGLLPNSFVNRAHRWTY